MDYALEFSRVEPLKFDHYRMNDSQIVDGLRQRSQQRIANSEYFKKEDRQIKRYEDQKDRKTVTLNQEKFLKERAELDSDKEQEKMFDNMNDPKRPVYEQDGYGEEGLDITTDYLELLGGNKVAIGRPEAGAPHAAVIAVSGFRSQFAKHRRRSFDSGVFFCERRFEGVGGDKPRRSLPNLNELDPHPIVGQRHARRQRRVRRLMF